MGQFNAHFSSVAGTTTFSVGEVIPDGQDGVLAGWTKGKNDFTTVPEAHLTHILTSGSNEYTLPFAGWGVGTFFLDGPDRSLVLGENGTAFALMPSNFIGIPGTGVVSFDIASGAVNWTWNWPTGSGDMVAATAGNGLVVKAFAFNNLGQRFAQIVRLDSNGQAALDTWTSDSASIQYAFGDTWLAQGSVEAISAPGLLWPFSVWARPNGEPTRTSRRTVTLQVHRVLDSSNGGQPTATDITVNEQVNEAIAYWQQQAGILLKWDGHFDDVPSCDLIAHPSGCIGPDAVFDIALIPTIPAPGQTVTRTVLEVLRRFCGELNNLDPRCTPGGSQLLFTGTVDTRNQFGGTPPINGVNLNLSFLGDGVAGLTTAHELGHQFQLPHCSLLAPPTVPPLFCGPDNLMSGGGLTATPGGNLFLIQIEIARKGARKWSQ